MKKTLKHTKAFFWTTLALCVVNAATVLAQPVEIIVTGGGFTVRGPDLVSFPAQPFSFNNQTSTADFYNTTTGIGYIEISDQNGGSPFSVAIGATDLTPGGSGICDPDNCIPKANLAIRNNDGTNPNITTIEGSAAHVSLDASTNFSNDPPASLDQQRVLLNGTGAAPGVWRIFPQLQQTTPGNTAIGDYSGTVTITIMNT